MLGLVLAVAIAMLRESARSAQQGRDPKYLEFENLVRGALSDLRIPTRWIGKSKRPVERDSDGIQ
jgi:hypothetical protein